MAYKDTDIIFIVTTKRGYIPQLRIAGPIPNPIRASIGLCISMLTAGVPLHQYDPITKKLVQLTISNIVDDTKFSVKVEEVVVQETISIIPVKEEIAVSGNKEIVVDNTYEDKLENVPTEEIPIEVEDIVISTEEIPDDKNDTAAFAPVNTQNVVKVQNNGGKNHKHGGKK